MPKALDQQRGKAKGHEGPTTHDHQPDQEILENLGPKAFKRNTWSKNKNRVSEIKPSPLIIATACYSYDQGRWLWPPPYRLSSGSSPKPMCSGGARARMGAGMCVGPAWLPPMIRFWRWKPNKSSVKWNSNIYIYHYIILHYYLISIKSIAAHKFPTTNLVHHPLAWHLPDLVKDWPDMQFQVQCLRTTCSAGVGSWPPWTQPGVKWTFSRYEMKSVWFDSSVRTIQIINRTPYCLKYIEKYDMISCNSL